MLSNIASQIKKIDLLKGSLCFLENKGGGRLWTTKMKDLEFQLLILYVNEYTYLVKDFPTTLLNMQFVLL